MAPPQAADSSAPAFQQEVQQETLSQSPNVTGPPNKNPQAQGTYPQRNNRTSPEGRPPLARRVGWPIGGGVRRRFDPLPTGAGRWTGTLSTSSKPVTATTRGNVFHLGYFAEDGLRYDEYYHLLPNNTIAYRASITDHEVEFARIDGTVRRRAAVAARN